MNKWYISIQNKARGPFTDLQMNKKIEAKEIEALTLTYKEGDTDWLPLEKQDIWLEAKKKTADQSQPVQASSAELVNDDWILLVEDSKKKGQFLQRGPFNDKKVRELIASGEVQLKDYCWKPGMSDWKLLFETVELGLSRKPKVEFKADVEKALQVEIENSDQEQQELDLDPLPQLEMELSDKTVSATQGMDFNNNELSYKKEEFLISEMKPENLSKDPIKNVPKYENVARKRNYNKGSFFSNRVFLSFLILAIFAGGVFQGFKNPETFIKPNIFQTGSLTNGLESIKDLFTKPEVPKASYVMIKQLYSNPKSILVRSDAKSGEIVKVIVKDKNKNLINLIGSTENTLDVETNIFGEAFIDMSKFDMLEDSVYIVSAQIGNLEAEKKYKFGFTSEKEINRSEKTLNEDIGSEEKPSETKK